MKQLPPPRELRALLAERLVTRREFARLAGLSPTHLSRILREQRDPGELAAIKLGRALEALTSPDHATVASRNTSSTRTRRGRAR